MHNQLLILILTNILKEIINVDNIYVSDFY
jgi:hypothetical protein